MTKVTEKKEYAIADYGDYEIHVKQAGAINRKFLNGISRIELKYGAKERMADKGLMSNDAIEKMTQQKFEELAQLYCQEVIVGWSGKFRDKQLPEFSVDEATKLLSNEDNNVLFLDLMQFAADQANFIIEVEQEQIKN